MKQTKKRFYILRNGRKVGETWAVSEDKAATNYWWKYDKGGDPYTYTERKPSDYDVIKA